MIKLTRVLAEISEKFEYGDKLFADPNDPSVTDRDKLKRLTDYEPNTKDERDFLHKLHKYFVDQQYKNIPVDTLHELLKLKSEFPDILDPRTSMNDNYLYRGTTLPLNLLNALEFVKHGSWYRADASDIKYIRAKGQQGYLSFSADIIVTQIFNSFGADDFPEDHFPVTVSVDIRNTDNFLFSPDFSDSLGIATTNEREVIYVGKEYPPSYIFIRKDIVDAALDWGEKYHAAKKISDKGWEFIHKLHSLEFRTT